MAAEIRRERSDSLANRERILDEAERLFASEGVDAPVHRIVTALGIGSGTLYRHFPTGSDLIRALYDRTVERFDAVAERTSEAPTGWDAITAFIDGSTAILFEFQATGDVMRRMALIDPDYQPGHRYIAHMKTQRERAQAEGSLRLDAAGTDIAIIPTLLGALRFQPEPVRSIMYARQRAIILDGLRPTEGEPLPNRPLTLVEHSDSAHN